MTTVLSQKGQVVLPAAVREQLRLTPGDDFEISVEDEDTIVLRRISHSANRGLVEHLLACPFPFDIPERERDDTEPISL
jgi:AbrB family looped-hinge helix DNA binding protein